MNDIAKVFHFGWPYFKRYWARLASGILLGIMFGVSNASFVWATKTLIGRMSAEPVPTVAEAKAQTGPDTGPLERLVNSAQARAQRLVDPWLPYASRPVDWRQLLGGLLFLPILVSIRGFIGYLSSYCMAWASERVVNDLRVNVLGKLSGLSLEFFNRSTMGDLLTRVNGDTAMLQRCLSLGFSDLIKEPVTILSIFVALCLIDWQLTLGAMVFFPLCVAPIIVLGKKARHASQASLNVNITQSSLLVEMLSNIRIVKAFGLENRQVDRFRKLSRELVHHSMKGIRAKEQINPIIETVSMIGLGMLIVYIAFRQRSVGDMVGYLTGMVFFYTPIKKLAALHVLFEQTSVGVKRLMHILSEQPKVKELPQPKPLPGFNSEIWFEDVKFAYGSELVLADVNLRIPRGLKLGVAGESGSGKSTLVNLLFRFYDPVEGAIKIDGHDLREVSLENLRQLMALVSQEVVVFDQSVAENIACGKPGSTPDEIEAAARAAYAHDFIRQLPQGYDTRLGERGVTLSLGQRQRIAIARAFIRDAPILVLDEATASLDSHSEAEVQIAIDRLTQNRTVVCVAHRLSTLSSMDQIIVLSRGQIVEHGTYGQLLQTGGVFAAMAKRQGIIAANKHTT